MLTWKIYPFSRYLPGLFMPALCWSHMKRNCRPQAFHLFFFDKTTTLKSLQMKKLTMFPSPAWVSLVAAAGFHWGE